MNDEEFMHAVMSVTDADDDFIKLIQRRCKRDKDSRTYLELFFINNPNATTSDVIEEIAHIDGIPYWDDELKEQVYKYPQFKYKILKKVNKHI